MTCCGEEIKNLDGVMQNYKEYGEDLTAFTQELYESAIENKVVLGLNNTLCKIIFSKKCCNLAHLTDIFFNFIEKKYEMKEEISVKVIMGVEYGGRKENLLFVFDSEKYDNVFTFKVIFSDNSLGSINFKDNKIIDFFPDISFFEYWGLFGVDLQSKFTFEEVETICINFINEKKNKRYQNKFNEVMEMVCKEFQVDFEQYKIDKSIYFNNQQTEVTEGSANDKKTSILKKVVFCSAHKQSPAQIHLN